VAPRLNQVIQGTGAPRGGVTATVPLPGDGKLTDGASDGVADGVDLLERYGQVEGGKAFEQPDETHSCPETSQAGRPWVSLTRWIMVVGAIVALRGH
jgi:hypothetical protein